VTVINQHLNYAIWRLLANPIFYDAIKIDSVVKIVDAGLPQTGKTGR